MRIQKKTISVLLLSEQEVGLLMQMVQEAKEGKIQHYSERETGPGQFFGISVAAENDEMHNPRNLYKRGKMK